MSEDIIKDFVKGFVKFEEEDQLKRAKETEEDFRKMLNTFEHYLADKLYPRTFSDIDNLDEIIREGERNDK